MMFVKHYYHKLKERLINCIIEVDVAIATLSYTLATPQPCTATPQIYVPFVWCSIYGRQVIIKVSVHNS